MAPEFHGYSGEVPPSESAILSKIETGLNNAVAQLELEPNESDHVKRQKYLWITVDEFTEKGEDPITHSWFKWGVSALAGPGERDPSQPLFTNSADAQPLFDATIEEFEEFFIEGVTGLPLDNWWEAEFLDFLEQFYSGYAPPRFQELYLAHLRLLRLIDDIQGAIMFGRDPARRETYYAACDYASELTERVLADENLKENYRYLTDFTNLFEDVVMMLASVESVDLEKGHLTAISEIKDFYQDHIWLMIAHGISLETAKGPNRGMILDNSSSNLQFIRSRHDSNYNTNREICDAMGLIPDVSDYSDFESGDEEFAQTFNEFMGVVDGRSTRE